MKKIRVSSTASFVAIALFLVCAPTWAQQSSPSGALAPGAPSADSSSGEDAPPRTPDRVQLKDGRTFEGHVLRYEEGKYVVIRLDDGRDMIFSGAVIAQVIPGGTPAVPPAGVLGGGETAPPGSIQVETTSQFDTKSGTFSHEVKTADEVERTLLDVRGARARREVIGADGSRTVMEVGAQEGAQYEHERDCADPNSEICKEKFKAGLSADGVGASYNKTTVERVKEPPNRYMVGSISAGVIALFGGFEAFGGTATLAARGGLGGKLPGPQGGMWNGAGFDLGVGISAISAAGSTTGLMNVGLGVGWNGLIFGKMNEETLKQSGFGWLLGARGVLNIPTQSGADPSPSLGPQITFTVPKYNAGTAKMNDLNLSLFILPVGQITAVMAQFGFGFST